MSYLCTPSFSPSHCAPVRPSTCAQHCNSDHGCTCCSPNLTADCYNNRIILHYIRADCSNTLYGTIFYDLDRDAVFFVNSRGEEFAMTQFVRGNGGGGNSSFRPIYKGGWAILVQYLINSVVFIGTKVYISLRLNIGKNPECNPLDWALFFDIAALINGAGGNGSNGNNAVSPNPRGAFIISLTYNIGDIVFIGLKLYWALATSIGANPINSPLLWVLYFDFTGLLPTSGGGGGCNNNNNNSDPCDVSETPLPSPITGSDIAALPTPRQSFYDVEETDECIEPVSWIPDIQFKITDQSILDGELYTCLIPHRASYANRPALTVSSWRYEGVVRPFPHQLYLLLVQATDSIEIDSRTGCSRKPYSERGQYDFDAQNPQAPIVYSVTRSSSAVELPLTCFRYIVSINRNVFDAANDIRILRAGWYTVSYNIAHSGNVRKLNSVVSKGRGHSQSEIEASHAECNVSGEIANTSHSFPIKLDAGTILTLQMKVFSSHIPVTNSNDHPSSRQQQTFKLYPHKTWMHIKSID